MRTPKEIALAMMKDGPERKEAEKMLGAAFDEMTPGQRALAAAVLSAFDGAWNASPGQPSPLRRDVTP